MTTRYFIGTKPRYDGSHTVHKKGCPFLPESGKRILLGAFQSPHGALREGRRYSGSPGSCLFCTKEHNEKKVQVFSEVHADPDFISTGQLTDSLNSLMFCSLS